ncbi:hypothetical protein ACFX19_031915 [Malus domestica]
MIRNVCWKTECYEVIPSVVSDLLTGSSEPLAVGPPFIRSLSAALASTTLGPLREPRLWARARAWSRRELPEIGL